MKLTTKNTQRSYLGKNPVGSEGHLDKNGRNDNHRSFIVENRCGT